ncbi:SagB family peptide dehydrogenase [Actinoplanes sp. NPDC024001]|uniref:SagB family peptide dehydrogenase n=1 Tax=Actinoplanes sp. NPDC024001 TaxID=3154598 RepID=UPI0033EE755C
MPPGDASIRPRMRRDTVLHRLPGAVLVRTGGDTLRLAGPDAYRLLSRLRPYLTGEHSLGDICAGVRDGQRAAVAALIHALIAGGAVIDTGPPAGPDFRSQQEYLAHLGGAPAFPAWRRARILVSGDGPIGQAARAVLAANGAGHPEASPPGGARRPGPDAVLYCAGRADPAEITALVRAARSGGPPLLTAAVVDGWAVLGPVTRPGPAGCWWCAVARLGLDPARPADAAGALTATVARMLGGALAYDAFRLLTGILPADPERPAVAQQLRTLRTLRIPAADGCPVCRAGAAADPAPALAAPAVTTIRLVADLPPAPADGPHALVAGYAAAMHRLVRSRPEPPGFRPDWTDRPATYTPYPQAPFLPLPEHAPGGQRPFGAGPGAEQGRCTLPVLSWLLRLSYGLLSRRLRIDSIRSGALDEYPTADWRRGAISGGGLYPLEIYWAAGKDGPVPPGVYHYAPAHHGLERLSAADPTDRIRAALRDPGSAATSHFLLISHRFWRNAFKYASLGYHLGTLDAGALLGTLDQLGAALDLPVRRLLWFDDRMIENVLGADPADEGVLAVVPLPWRPTPPSFAPGDPPPVTRPPADERSRTVLRFAWAAQVHRATMLGALPAPDPAGEPPATVTAAVGAGIALSEPAGPWPAEPVGELLPRRRSSFGQFAGTALGTDQLGALLRLTTRAGGYRGDTVPDRARTGWTRLSVLANHVAGLPAGGYRYEPSTATLHPAGPGRDWAGVLAAVGADLTNYDLGATAAVLVISGRPDAMLRAYGPRGYRLLNAEVGTVAQAGCLAAAAIGVGCGAVLNLDHPAVDDVLGFPGTDERSVLCLLIGGERDGGADFVHHLR